MLLFLIIAAGASSAVIAGIWFAATRIDDPAAPRVLTLAAAIALTAINGLTLWGWLKVDERGVRLIEQLARLMQTVTHSGTSAQAIEDAGTRGDLGALGPAAGEMVAALKASRADLASAQEAASAKANEQKSRLEAVLRELDQSILICTRAHRVVLCNPRAVQVLSPLGEVGLGRSLSGLLSTHTIDHALDRLDRSGTGSATAACASTDGSRIFRVRLSLLPHADREPAPDIRYMATLSDITDDLAGDSKRNEALNRFLTDTADLAFDLVKSLDSSAKANSTAAGVIRSEQGSSPADTAHELATKIANFQAGRDLEQIMVWPTDEIDTRLLFEAITKQPGCADLTISPGSERIRCDCHAMSCLWRELIQRVRESPRRRDFVLTAIAGPDRMQIELTWDEEPLLPGESAAWLAAPLADVPAHQSGHDVLFNHQTGLHADQTPDGRSRLSMPLPCVIPPANPLAPSVLAARPEFYDFDVQDRPVDENLEDLPLNMLTLVAFDTETTGLSPSGGDQIVQIAGVRIVNGRVLLGERFDTLVNPQRKVPASSTAIHGLTDEMLRDAPTIGEVLKRFHAYAGDAVLLAHNAAFDMAFLRLPPQQTRFDNPVLDTVLLSAFVHDHTGKHTLDDLAERFEIPIDAALRHTAIGDAVATAQVFVKLLPLLEARGVRTLGQAMAVSGDMRSIRKAQARY